jgi:hypothetical protein
MVSFTHRQLFLLGNSVRCRKDRKLGGPQKPPARGEEENACPYLELSSDPSVVKQRVSRYIDCDNPAPEKGGYERNLCFLFFDILALQPCITAVLLI